MSAGSLQKIAYLILLILILAVSAGLLSGAP